MAVTLRASKQGLEIVDQARRKKGWEATAASWYGAANTSVATLKRFRGGKPIQQDVFMAICKAVGVENWEEIVDDAPLPQTNSKLEFFAYDDAWVGREQLVAELVAKVRGEIRVLILTGIAGIGKTALGEKLALELLGDWRKFKRVNFDNPESTDFVSVTTELLISWGETVTPDDRKDVQQLMYRLIRRLRENRYLLLIDSLEEILKGNEEEGWNDFKDEWWLKFLQGLLSAESCQSRLILTSQDLPGQMQAESSRYERFYYCQPLSGLEEKERLDLFDKTGLDVGIESSGRQYLERIGSAYEGHPLALRIIAGEIGSNPFGGNVVAYWNKYGNEIEEVEKAIEEAKTKGIVASADDQWQLDRYTRSLRRKVRSRLEQTFNRLKKDLRNAYLLLCEVSVYRCPVPEDFWLSHLEDWDCDEEQQSAALDALCERYLVEEIINNNQYLLRQHNLIRSVALERLKKLDQDDE